MSEELNYSYVALIGAYERDNFGDILFYKVTEKLLSPWPTVPLTLFSASLHEEGIENVFSASTWFENCKTFSPKSIICVGGEILNCDLIKALSMDFDNHLTDKYLKLNRDEKWNLARTICPTNSRLAYVHDKQLFSFKSDKNVTIALNSVGGTNIDKKNENWNELSNILKRVDFVSVRDSSTFNIIDSVYNSEVLLAPDVVSLISDCCKTEVDAARKTNKIKNILHSSYIVFQANEKYLLNNDLHKVASMLSKVCNEHHFKLVIQPAGMAHTHDSLSLYEKIQDYIHQLNSRDMVYIHKSRNIWDQVSTIADSSCFIGTSLHGRIVAASFNRPRLSLENEKVFCYASTWDDSIQPANVKIADLPGAFNKALSVKFDVLKTATESIKEKSMHNINVLRGSLGIDEYDFDRDLVVEHIKKISNLALLDECNHLRSNLISYASLASSEKRKRIKAEQDLNLIENSIYWKALKKLKFLKVLMKN